MTVEELALALGQARHINNGQWVATCPAHDDTHASLHITTGNKHPIVFTCRSGCSNPDILTALKSRGLWGKATASAGPPPVVAHTSPAEKEDDWTIITPVPDDAHSPFATSNKRWAYRDAEGRLLGYVERVDDKQHGKQIYPLTYCRSKAGAISWKRKHQPKPRPLYGLDLLAKSPHLPVLIVEGEKCADVGTANLSGFVTISWSQGVAGVKYADWTPLKGRQCVMWPDNDVPGKKAGLEIKAILDAQNGPDGPQTRVLDIPLKFDHGFDIADAAAANWSPSHLLAFIEAGSVPPAEEPVEGADNPFFIALGRDHSTFYFRYIHDPQVIPFSSAALANHGNLMSLAPLTYWESHFMGRSGTDWSAATSDTIQRCHARGICNPLHVRGRGAWIEDDDRLVLHTGQKLFVDGAETELHQFRSRYSYEADWDLGLDLNKPLKDAESLKLLMICRNLLWRKPVSADLLAGWIVIAPFCGALDWRPHIWITGPSGTGKSTVVRELVKPMVALGESFEGPSTQSGVRQSLKNDARPVLFDEAERTNQHTDARLQDLIDLIMVASSGVGKIAKGTAGQQAISVHSRSCFCLASINPALDRVAVQRRVTALELGEKGHPDQWRKLQAEIAQLPRGEALIARTAKNFKVLRRNISQFVRAVAEHMGNQPEGDQLGPMLAGAYSLVSSKEVTLDEARVFVRKRDWDEHKLSSDDNDGNQIMVWFCCATIRLVRPQGGVERSIAELLRIAADEKTDPQGIDSLEAHDHLGRTSVKLSDDGNYVYIARRSPELERVFRNTAWEKNWHDTFGRVPGAQREVLIVFAGGRPQQAVGVPREMIIPPRGKEEAA